MAHLSRPTNTDGIVEDRITMCEQVYWTTDPARNKISAPVTAKKMTSSAAELSAPASPGSTPPAPKSLCHGKPNHPYPADHPYVADRCTRIQFNDDSGLTWRPVS